jgi:hypothetical protein
MKNINKKASSIALATMVVAGGVATSGVTSHATNTAPNNKSYLTVDQIKDRQMVEKHTGDYNYSYRVLEKMPKHKKIDLTYKDRWVFERNIKNDISKKGKDCLYVKIGSKSLFRIIPNKFSRRHNQLIWNELIDYREKYNFKILITGDNMTSTGRTLFDTKIRTVFKNDEQLKNDLLNRTFMYYDNIYDFTRITDIDHLFYNKGYVKLMVDDLLFILQK